MIAVVVGGAACVDDDLARLPDPPKGGYKWFAVNASGSWLDRPLTAWCSLHPEFSEKKGWIEDRRKAGFPDAPKYLCHRGALHRGKFAPWFEETEPRFPGQPYNGGTGSSGHFAAKVALVDFQIQNVILCGVPLEPMPHKEGHARWVEDGGELPVGFRGVWKDMPAKYAIRIRSMSGWTKTYFGGPND